MGRMNSGGAAGSRRFWDGERGRILAILALAGLPLILFTAASVWRSVNDAKAQIVNERSALARAAALTASGFIEGHLDVLETIALTRSITDPSSITDLGSHLQRIGEADRNIVGLGLFGADGWDIAGTNTTPGTVYLGDRDYFQQVLATGQPAISPALIGRVAGLPSVVMAVPVTFADGSRGVLIGPLSLDRLREELSRLPGDSSVSLILVDNTGQAFVHPDPAVVQQLTSLRGRPDVDAALAEQTGSPRYAGGDGAEILAAYAPVAYTGWGVIAVQPAAEAFNLLDRQVREALLLLALALALTVLIGWYLDGRLVTAYRREQEATRGAEKTAAELLIANATNESRRQFLESLISSAPVAIAVLTGPEHRYVSVNPVYQAMKLGVDMTEQPFRDVFPELEDQQVIRALDRVYETGQPFTGVDAPATFVQPDGSQQTRYFTFVFARHEGAGDHGPGVLVIAVETTNAVIARHRVEQEKDEFLSIASHELKTPLTSLRLVAQTLQRSLARGVLDADRLERHVTAIQTQVDRASSLIADLLDVSRIQRGSLQLRHDAVNLVEIAEAAVARARDTLPYAATHEIVTSFSEDRLTIPGDEARLDQVLTNLLSNAIKYSPEGGRIEVRLDADGDSARLSVSDQGIGVPDSERDRLFAPFSRTTPAREASIEGTGLGLYISRRIVEAHLGSIEVSATPGGGATFTVRLPRPVLAEVAG